MRFLLTLALAFPLAMVAAPATAQEYWEYETWESEWEQHQPTRGLEYEYEDEGYATNLDDVETEQYEYEADEGYHEQEWYDPSDWFEIGRDMDYESDDDEAFTGGYYGDGYYDDDWFYDYYDYGYAY